MVDLIGFSIVEFIFEVLFMLEVDHFIPVSKQISAYHILMIHRHSQYLIIFIKEYSQKHHLLMTFISNLLFLWLA